MGRRKKDIEKPAIRKPNESTVKPIIPKYVKVYKNRDIGGSVDIPVDALGLNIIRDFDQDVYEVLNTQLIQEMLKKQLIFIKE